MVVVDCVDYVLLLVVADAAEVLPTCAVSWWCLATQLGVTARRTAIV